MLNVSGVVQKAETGFGKLARSHLARVRCIDLEKFPLISGPHLWCLNFRLHVRLLILVHHLERREYRYHHVTLFPDSLIFFSSRCYRFLVLLDPTLLSFVSSVCLLIVLLDYLAPIVMSKIFNPDSWTGQKEKKFEEISSKIASAYCSIKSDICYFYHMKESRPKMVI